MLTIEVICEADTLLSGQVVFFGVVGASETADCVEDILQCGKVVKLAWF